MCLVALLGHVVPSSALHPLSMKAPCMIAPVSVQAYCQAQRPTLLIGRCTQPAHDARRSMEYKERSFRSRHD